MTDAVIPTTAVEDRPAGPLGGSRRLGSIDVCRGLIVVGSIVVTHLPASPPYAFAVHAEWFGLTLTDMMFPLFVGLFGVGLSLAYRSGIRWGRMWQRSWRLFAAGLVFNGIVGWDLSPGSWRITGILQLFAVVGVVVTFVAAVVGAKWWHVLLAGVAVLAGYQVLLGLWAGGCIDGVLAPGCNPSATIDPAVFTASHVYRGGAAGHDPEGLTAILGATGTALVGFAVGRILWRWRGAGAATRLLALGAGLVVASLLVAEVALPISKRLWTPSFALLAGAVTAVLVALTHVLVDRLPRERPSLARRVDRWAWLLVAYGRNSLLIFFGRYIVDVVLARISLGALTDGRPIDEAVVAFLGDWTPHAPIAYLLLTLAGWSAVAVVLHRRGRYIRV